jgi:hypothetical protein
LEFEENRTGVERLTAIILSLSTSQRLLTQSALDLQTLCLASKHQIKDAIEQADEVGDILEVFISLLKAETKPLAGLVGDDRPLPKQSYPEPENN